MTSELTDLDRQVADLFASYREAVARGDNLGAEAILDQRDEVARQANAIRRQVERGATAAAVRLALAGALVDLDLDPVRPITTTRGGLKLPSGILLALPGRAA